MWLQESMDLYEKLEILTDAAKYDVACTSSGADRRGDGAGMGSANVAGICHSFSADGRCISLLKILFTNECIYDCKYCINRRSNDVRRASFTPDEVCTLTMEFYRRNYIEGVFLSSGGAGEPGLYHGTSVRYFMETATGVPVSGIYPCEGDPGSQPELVERLGFLADRMSINLELPTAEGLKMLAPHKTRKKILEPMRLVQTRMMENRQEIQLYRGGPQFVPAGRVRR